MEQKGRGIPNLVDKGANELPESGKQPGSIDDECHTKAFGVVIAQNVQELQSTNE